MINCLRLTVVRFRYPSSDFKQRNAESHYQVPKCTTFIDTETDFVRPAKTKLIRNLMSRHKTAIKPIDLETRMRCILPPKKWDEDRYERCKTTRKDQMNNCIMHTLKSREEKRVQHPNKAFDFSAGLCCCWCCLQWVGETSFDLFL